MKSIVPIWLKSAVSNLGVSSPEGSTWLNPLDGNPQPTQETQGPWKKHLLSAHMKAAEAYASLSHSRRAKVGAVIVKDHRIISVGYNGMPESWDNDCEDITEDGLVTKPEVLHAEMNALMFAARNGLATEGCSLVITLMPCFHCAKSIYQAGLKNVFYRDAYRDESGVKFLRQCGIAVRQA